MCSATQIFLETLKEPYLSRGVVLLNTIGAIGGALNYILSWVMIRYISWKASFITVATMLLLLAVIWYMVMPKLVTKSKEQMPVVVKTEKQSSRSDNIDQNVSAPKVSFFTQITHYGTILVILGAFFIGLLRESVSLWIPSYMNEVFGLSSSLSIIVTMLVPCLQVCGALLGGRVGRKVRILHFPAGIAFALSGCCLTTGRLEDAKSILRTFMAYEKDGLVPNLFPEGESKPMYNTVDAALLLIDCVWQYVSRTGDYEFVNEAWQVMEHIIEHYRKGTHHKIGMDTDGLIYAGGGLDQVTWMDVCVNGILPTPRHGKPVEINAYWYNALCIMDRLAKEIGQDAKDYSVLAEQVKDSFVKAFYIEEKGYLRDVISGTAADEQLRCNQIWAVSMPFTMLTAEMEKQIVDTVERYLYTPCGLRTLSPKDSEYHPYYGGAQVERDMAYHQGTTWVFPMGAYYLAKLKVLGSTKEAAAQVREQLETLEPMLRQGCLGQLPEIYDGEFPTEGKGCFAQAWSVGEMLRVFEAIENIK